MPLQVGKVEVLLRRRAWRAVARLEIQKELSIPHRDAESVRAPPVKAQENAPEPPNGGCRPPDAPPYAFAVSPVDPVLVSPTPPDGPLGVPGGIVSALPWVHCSGRWPWPNFVHGFGPLPPLPVHRDPPVLALTDTQPTRKPKKKLVREHSMPPATSLTTESAFNRTVLVPKPWDVVKKGAT
jgi:hypothetical protein